MNYFLTLASVALLLSSCKDTEFDAVPTSCLGMTTQINIDRLKELETKNVGKAEFKVAIIADSHNGAGSLANVLKRIGGRTDLDFILLLGDLSDNALPSELDWTCMALQDTHLPVLPVIGNHDSLTNGKNLWAQYFGPFDYSFSYLGTKFIAYNNNTLEFGTTIPKLDLIQQESVLQPGEIRYHTIAASHVPPGTEVNSDTQNQEILKALNDDGIPFTVHGHLHHFQFEKDAFGNLHYVVGAARNSQWAIMTVSQTQIQMENCSPDCVPAPAPQ